MENTKHPILIGYTHKMVADGLEAMIDVTDDFTVKESIAIEKLTDFLVGKSNFEIIIVELNYPNHGNLSFLTQIKARYPVIHLVILSRSPSADLGKKLINIDIDGFLLKTGTKYDLINALYKAVNGKKYFSSDLIKIVLSEKNCLQQPAEVNLTPRETEILALLVSCKTNIHIAKELGLSENTVKTHRKKILEKFGVNNIFGMIRYACRARLIDYGPDGFCTGCPHYC